MHLDDMSIRGIKKLKGANRSIRLSLGSTTDKVRTEICIPRNLIAVLLESKIFDNIENQDKRCTSI